MSATSTSDDAVNTIVDLLSGVSNTRWVGDNPPDSIKPRWETTPQDREANPNPAVYVWTPVDASLSKGDAKGSYYSETLTVEAEVWTMDSQQTFDYHRNVKDILDDYDTDNEVNTTFHSITPSSVADRRDEKIVRQTDHYIIGVQAELHNHRD